MRPHWDVASLLLYIILGCISMLAVKKIKKIEYKTGKLLPLISKPYIIWFITWIICSVWRYVDRGIGGSDAITYVEYFQECLNPNYKGIYATHLDIGYQMLCKAIRLFTSDYHVLFFIVYGLIIISYQLFIKEFCFTEMKFTPMLLMFFVYLRGFNTIRTNLSVACILLGLVLMNKKRIKSSMILFVFSCLIHKASLIYVSFVVFYFLNKKRETRIWHEILWCVVISITAKYTQKILMFSGIGEELNGAYSSYAARSLKTSFFDNGWKIAFGQLLLLGLVVLLKQMIQNDVSRKSILDQERFKMIYLLCVYDFMMIPVCYTLSIWRGYEYFYLPRLIMWGEVVWVISKIFTKKSQIVFNIGVFFTFVGWMIFRLYNTWESSCLMPYIFEPFNYFFY